MNTTNEIQIKAYSVAELASIYKVSRYTFLKWITPHQQFIGEKQGRFFTHLQVITIFERLGVPGSIED